MIDIGGIDQSLEMDDTLVSFIDLSSFLPISSIYIGRNIYHLFIKKLKLISCKQ